MAAEKPFVKKTRPLLILLGLLLIMTCALLILPLVLVKKDSGALPENGMLSSYEINEIQEIHIKNQYGEYSVWQEDGSFIIADLPMDLVNGEYLDMLLDESARVEYESVVSENDAYLDKYGLDKPQAEVTISYKDGGYLGLCIGDEEKISRGKYFLIKGKNDVYLMNNSRVVRFLMPVTRFINFEIVPFIGFQSPLRAVKNLILSGGAFPRRIVIEEVQSDDADRMREAASFGVATHLVLKPALHEIDQKECIAVFGSLSGLLNKEVFAYNCSDEELETLGFNAPYAMAEYDFKRNAEADIQHIILKAVRHEGGYLLQRDDQRVVHRIENEAFVETSYERLVMRWFLTPFITDLASIKLRLGQNVYTFLVSGETNRELAVSLNGNPLSIESFRKFYTMLISASNDGLLLPQPVPKTEMLLELTFNYRDSQKAPDVMRLYDGGSRKLNVEVKGIIEFAMLRRYITVVTNAIEALSRGDNFTVDW
jgi:hypothetical protein